MSCDFLGSVKWDMHLVWGQREGLGFMVQGLGFRPPPQACCKKGLRLVFWSSDRWTMKSGNLESRANRFPRTGAREIRVFATEFPVYSPRVAS